MLSPDWSVPSVSWLRCPLIGPFPPFSRLSRALIGCCRRGGRAVHPAEQAVPDAGAPEALVARRVGGAPRDAQTGAPAGGRTVWRGLDG